MKHLVDKSAITNIAQLTQYIEKEVRRLVDITNDTPRFSHNLNEKTRIEVGVTALDVEYEGHKVFVSHNGEILHCNTGEWVAALESLRSKLVSAEQDRVALEASVKRLTEIEPEVMDIRFWCPYEDVDRVSKICERARSVIDFHQEFSSLVEHKPRGKKAFLVIFDGSLGEWRRNAESVLADIDNLLKDYGKGKDAVS